MAQPPTRREGELALATATRLGLTGEELADVETPALVHGIGKIGIRPGACVKFTVPRVDAARA